MIRNSFNGGEVSPSMRLRADLDNYQHCCSEVLNFDIMETGGVTKRRGFEPVGIGGDFDTSPITRIRASSKAALFTFHASDDNTYPVILDYASGKITFTVYALTLYNVPTEYELLFTAQYPYALKRDCDLREIKSTQINGIMLFTHKAFPPAELGIDEKGKWYLKKFEFKEQPWKDEEIQDVTVTVTPGELYTEGRRYTLKKANETTNVNAAQYPTFRVSYYTEEENIKIPFQDATFYNINIYTSTGEHTINKYNHYKGQQILYWNISSTGEPLEDPVTYWTCKEDWTEDLFVEGMYDPHQYPNVFVRTDNHGSNPKRIWKLSKDLGFKKGDIFCFRTSYLEWWTCIKDCTQKNEFNGKENEYWSRGYLLGYAPCKGKWTFYNTGTWYGEFEVRACYKKEKNNFFQEGYIGQEWEKRGAVFSKVGEAINQEISGDESQEECWLGLFCNKLRAYDQPLGSDNWFHATDENYPQQSCDIRLCIESYKKDLIFEQAGTTANYVIKKDFTKYTPTENADFPSVGFTSEYWSEPAFCDAYGYPTCVTLLDQRLVFAGTPAQPMTVWMSQNNDIDNFDVIDADNSALNLTISSETQEPIRWLASQRGRLLVGTSEGEFVVDAGDGGGITNNNATCVQHGFNGSEATGCAMCDDSVIYISKGGIRAKRYGYSEDVDGYISTDLNVYAEHILQGHGGVKQIAVQKTPYSRIYFVTTDGTLAVLAYNQRHNVTGWSRYKTSLGKFISITNMPRANAPDQLFALILTDEAGGRCTLYTSGPDVSDFNDDGMTYHAVLSTNILSSTEIGGRTQNLGEIMLYIGEDTPAEGLYVTTNGWVDKVPVPDQKTRTLHAGWNSELGFSTHSYEATVGFQSSSSYGLTVLALQAK